MRRRKRHYRFFRFLSHLEMLHLGSLLTPNTWLLYFLWTFSLVNPIMYFRSVLPLPPLPPLFYSFSSVFLFTFSSVFSFIAELLHFQIRSWIAVRMCFSGDRYCSSFFTSVTFTSFFFITFHYSVLSRNIEMRSLILLSVTLYPAIVTFIYACIDFLFSN